jgi:N-ethylmaleimide reductase
MNNSKLFLKSERNGVSFASRIAMAPMTRCRAVGNIANDLMSQYYAQRSAAGLIITEGNAPSPNGLGYARIPGIFNQQQIDGWKKVTEAVHKKGGKIFTQLMHTGRVAHSANMPEGSVILAPSAVKADVDMWTDVKGMQKVEVPKEMTANEIQTTIGEIVQAAKNAIDANFDGIELHAANGYLLEQFLNPNSNIRTDEYGGNIKNRFRFIIEVTKAVGEAIGFSKVGIRISPYSTFNTMPLYDEIQETYHNLVKELDKLDIAYLHVIDYAIRMSNPQLLKEIRREFSGVLMLNGGYTAEKAVYAIENEGADMISFGSSFIANPDLPSRIKNNIKWAVPDTSTYYMADEKGYTDYPNA